MRPDGAEAVTGAQATPREWCLQLSSSIPRYMDTDLDAGPRCARARYRADMTTPTTTDVPTLRSTVPGVPAARTVDSVNPADLTDVVARVELAGPDGIVQAARRANAAQREWAAVPAPVRGRVIA